MPIRFKIAILALLTFAPFSIPVPALADAGQTLETSAPVSSVQLQTLPTCPQPFDKNVNLAQTSQTECCKGNKGICGCRAGKIVCCDGTASPNCTCHGDEGFIE